MTYIKKLITKNLFPHSVSAILIFCYTTVTLKLLSGYELSLFLQPIGFSLIVFSAFAFIVSPIIDLIMFTRISKTLETVTLEEISPKQRTRVFEDLMITPLMSAVKVFILFMIATILVTADYMVKLGMEMQYCYSSITEGLFGSVLAGLLSYGTTNRICSDYACSIVKAGVDKTYVNQKKHFGIKLSMQMNIYVTLPLVMNVILLNVILFSGFRFDDNGILYTYSSRNIQTKHAIIVCIINCIIQGLMIFFFYKRTSSSAKKMKMILEAMTTSNLESTNYVDTDIEDETAYNHYLANNMLTLLQDTLNQFEEIGRHLRESSLNLSQISTETNATYLEQSSGTTEVVSSMKLTTEKSHQIRNKISEVAKLAQDTESDVQNGNKVLATYYENIKHIEEHNKETIHGIQDLNAKINSIWDVVSIINSIADQTKIIAFNAELESTGFKERGNNFKNVSNEIRRLANSTVDSTREIKERINIIQDSVDELRTSMESTLPSISKGRNLVENLKSSFDNIQSSANTNAYSAIEISGLINEQALAFEQIENTLQQVNSGLKNFEEATMTISKSSQEMQKSAIELSTISKTGDNND